MTSTYPSEDRIDLIPGNYVSRIDGRWYQHEELDTAPGIRVLLRTARSLDMLAPHDGTILNVKIY